MSVKVPEVSKVYSFYDDGKLGTSRQYLAMVTRVIPFDSEKLNENVIGYALTEEDELRQENEHMYQFLHKLVDYWKNSVKEIDWVFAEETDYIIECAIPEYDEHLIYCARTKTGRWFSFEVQTSWQCGLLDVEGENDEYLIDELKQKREKNIL